MRYLIVLAMVSMVGCASTPMEQRRASTMDCIERFVRLESHIKDAGHECRAIYRSPARSKR